MKKRALSLLNGQIIIAVIAAILTLIPWAILPFSYLTLFLLTLIALDVGALYSRFIVIPWAAACKNAALKGWHKQAIYKEADASVLFPPPMFLRDLLLKNTQHIPDLHLD